MFLHLSQQCLDEGGLASSNLTHHSNQLTWLHRKIQPAYHNKKSNDAIPTIIVIYFLNVALSESSESHENVLSVKVTAASPSIKSVTFFSLDMLYR